MLDNPGQIKAFKILSDTGLVTPASITISRQAASQASALAETISALLLVGATYPATVSDYTGQLSGITEQLNQANVAASTLADAMSPYTTPSDLVQMKIGWECHVKGNEITPEPPFSLVIGMGDTSTPESLLNTVNVIDTGDLTSAMGSINAKVGAAVSESSADGSTSSTTAMPVISAGEVQTLKNAVEALTIAAGKVSTVTTIVKALAESVNSSTELARKGLEYAVAVTLTETLQSSETMLPAISLIVPDGVISSL